MTAVATLERLRQPAYARELADEIRRSGKPSSEHPLHAHIGARAWDRARNRPGERLVVDLNREFGPADYDFSAVCGLNVLLNAAGADIVLARAIAIRMCEYGARMVVLLHGALPKSAEFFYSERAS